MLDIKDVHLAIQDICCTYTVNNPVIHVNTLITGTGVPRSEVIFYLNLLKALGYICFKKNSEELFSLTEAGKMAYVS
jgi:hypothetical protein